MDKFEFINIISELMEEVPLEKIDSFKEELIDVINNVSANIKSFRELMER